ncbi:hypothetical protein DCC81_03645 [Chitinophaga parva]|uniref:TerB family tellurite resistance protein n=1 Tax=Chitinophaga parva TaxID=2169414 RepID=A0A2T7BLM9_9BACT|nr:hypothetical protein [Chitinophaga parva]PUZ28587.1 hypothetical protein DCC81_03645 [Chitinophaga parva]
MKKILILLFTPLFILGPTMAAHAQEAEIEQLLLNVEKLAELKSILQKMYDGYKILTEGYEKVKEITSGNFNLHEVFLDGLYLVSPQVRKYHRVADIIDAEATILKEYKGTFGKIKSSGAFSSDQLGYLQGIYNNVLDGSLKNIDDLTMILTDSQMRMSDDERLSAIDRIYANMQKHLVFLRDFNRQTSVAASQTLKERSDLQSINNLYNK